MNDLPKEGLRALVAQEGMALLGDPERARALLEERFPQFPEEIEALVRVLEEGVMESLAQGADLSAQAPELEARTGLSLEQILWGAQGWVDALPPAPPSGEDAEGPSGTLAPEAPPEAPAPGDSLSLEEFFRRPPLSREPSQEERNLALLGLSGDRGRLFTAPWEGARPLETPPLPRGLVALLQSSLSPLGGGEERQAPLSEPEEPRGRGGAEKGEGEVSPEPEVPVPLAETLPPPAEALKEEPWFAFPEDEEESPGRGGFPSKEPEDMAPPIREEEVEALAFSEAPEKEDEGPEGDRAVPRRTLAAFPPPLPPREFHPAFSEEGPSSEEGDRGVLIADDRAEVESLLGKRPPRRRLSPGALRLASFLVLGVVVGSGVWFWWHRPQRFFDQGQELFQRKDFALATASFQRGLEEDPRNADALFMLGESFRALGSADEALEAYEKVLRLTSGDAMLFVGMGEAHLVRGEPILAVKAFDLALSLVPTFSEARKGLGLAYLARGDYPKAREALEKALEGRRDDLPLMKTLAAVRRMMEDPGGARALYDEVLLLTSDDQEAREGRAATLREEEELRRSREERRAQEEVRGLLARGEALRAEGNPREALGAFLRVRSLDPRSPEALEGAMESLLALGQKDRAEALFQEALKGVAEDPQGRDAMEQARAEALFRHEQLMLFSAPPVLRGEEMLREGNPGGALVLFREALSADAKDPRSWKGLGRALLTLGSPDEALEAFRRGEGLVSGDADLARGIKEAREARELEKRRERAAELGRQGEKEEARGKYRQAVKLFRQALDLASDDQSALRGAARVTALQGLHGDAAAYYRRLLRVASGDQEARKELARLERLGGARVTPGAGHPSEASRLAELAPGTSPHPTPSSRAMPLAGPVTPARERLGELHARKGGTLAAQGAYAEAAREYRRALDLSPWRGAYRNNLGWALARMGVTEGALGEFRQAVLQDGDRGDVQYNYGWVLARQGEVPKAARALVASLCLDDGSDGAYLVIREPFFSSRDVERALSGDARPFVQAAQAAAALRPEDEVRYWNVALAVYEAGRRSPSLAVSPTALERIFLGHAWMVQDPARARQELDQEEEGEGWMGSLRLTLLGQAASREGRPDRAADAYRRALELDPRNDAARAAWQALGRLSETP
ncbi:MAG TPA: tetratricopeptide repeat protein [Synergistaceae bacterium]|nr:tetratricopeptide repeat protein [Synergistaceae bacterium]